MDESLPTLQAVESFIAERQKRLEFPPWLEWHFENDTRDRRVERIRHATLTTAIIYNLYLIPDWLLVGDKFAIALFLHALVVTPWIFCVGWLITTKRTSKFVREAAWGSIPVLIVLQILTSFVLTSSPDAAHYQYFILLVLLFANTVQRLPFRYALAASGAILFSHTIAILMSGHLAGPVAMVAVLTIWVTAYLTLTSSYYLERDARRNYLHVLRDRLRHVEVEIAAKHDALTGLANRHYLDARLADLWQMQSASSTAVIMLDIDHFKSFNDRYGHIAGDACIKRVAQCVRTELRSNDDLAVRYGGEELMVLMPQTEIHDAVRVAERIRRAVEALCMPHEAAGVRQVVTVSLGVASAPVPAVTSAELIGSADIALYAAKRNGRNQVWPPLLRGRGVDDDDAPARVVHRL